MTIRDHALIMAENGKNAKFSDHLELMGTYISNYEIKVECIISPNFRASFSSEVTPVCTIQIER